MAKELGLLEREWERMQNIPAHKSHAVSRTGTVWTGNIQAAWELDFWGKFRNAAEAARESLISAEDTQRALALSVAGQVCSAYFDLLNYDAQWELTQKTLAARREYAELYEKQYAAGAVSTLDILRIRTQVATLTDSLAQAAQQKEQAEAVLLLLVGASPAEILQGKTNRGKLEEISPLAVIPSGLPSALLERRPDILSAEAALKAAHFKVGEARAAFFPSIDLTGSLGMESTALGKLFSGSAGTWTFGGNASLPLLTFGKNLAGLRQAEASVREAVAAYELTVQQAFRDIRESLAVQKAMAEGADSLAEAVRYMEQAADLARLRYAEGYVPYLDVLEAEQTLYSSRMELSSRRAGQLSAVAQVCVALGGGWQSENL
jgi:multidrug efflux system outer membrane protein